MVKSKMEGLNQSESKIRIREEKIVTRTLEGEMGNPPPPPSSTFGTIHPIDMKFGTYKKFHLYFQLSETTWYLIDFHGDECQLNDVTGGRRLLGFLNFQILFKLKLCTSKWRKNSI